MAILLFNRSKNFHFRDWLSDLKEELVIFTQVDLPNEADYDLVVKSESFDRDALIELRAVDEHRRYSFRTVMGHSEYDLIRTARLREYFGLEGQSVESALAFRDKVIMKEHVSRAGIAVPSFQRVASPLDLFQFAERHGYPLVIKPVDGGGSRNTQVVQSEEELRSYLAGGLSPNMMVETFVEGDMYHVDGLVHEGKILFSCVSRYLNGCLAFQTGQSGGSMLLDPTGVTSQRFQQAVEAVLAALPGAPTMAFHAEFFRTVDDRILLCEVASRTGGGRIPETIREAYGVDLNRQWIRLLAGIEEPVTPVFGGELAGFLLVPPRHARLVSMPEKVPFEWVTDCLMVAKPGQALNNPVSSVDMVASFIVKGPTEEVIESRLRELNHWFTQRLVWEDAV